MRLRTVLLLGSLTGALAGCAHRAQVADDTFRPPAIEATYADGARPVVAVDEAHGNYHTIAGRYRHFATLLERDGCEVRPFATPLAADALADVDVLVIANALAEENQDNWTLPTPSAFTRDEIAAVRGWVERGGSLLLIADHMPFPGAAADLGAAFGVTFDNGFAINDTSSHGITTFRRADGTLHDHPITNGRETSERVDHVMTFTGQAFTTENDAEPLLVFGAGWTSFRPETAWAFAPETPRSSATGWLQGAAFRYGDGRVAVFGEAAMFTAQRAARSGRRMGMNHPRADQNAQFVLNVVHWLAGSLEPWPDRPTTLRSVAR